MIIRLSDHFSYKKLLIYSLPAIITMLFTSVYSIVDGFFISNYVGKTPFAAVNIIMPVLMILGCFGFMIGTGGSAIVAKTIGEGKKQKANEYFTMLLYFTLILGIALSIAGIIFMPKISYMLGATKDMIKDCVLYGRIMCLFNTAFMLQYFFQSFFIAAEKSRIGLIVTISAGVTNIVLDALFIIVFKWGVSGAALASIIGQCIGGVLPLFYFLKPNSSLLQIQKAKIEPKILLDACINGSSELMTNISSSIVSMLYNFQLMKFAGEDGIAAYGVIMYVQLMFLAIFMGYSYAVAPIISYNYGAKNHFEIKNILKKSCLIMIISGLFMMLLSQIFSRPLSNIFVSYDLQLLNMTINAFKIFAFSFILAGINVFSSSFFTALNNGFVSAAISFARTLLFQTIAVLILPILFGLNGIWYAITVAEICATIFAAVFIFSNRHKYNYA